MKKSAKKKQQNQGNSFIVVVATISFLAVLVSALLVAVALCYRLKAYDINARDNFYYLEQAMDEIYAGVGGDAMTLLNEAYDDTLEVMVYYDTAKQTYVTMDNDEANKICKNTFMYKLQNDTRYDTKEHLQDRLADFLSYPYADKSGNVLNDEGIQLSIDKIERNSDDLTVCSLILKREATYSTYNARAAKDSGGTVAAGDTFIQTITTDLVIAKPLFNVNFNALATDLDELYQYSMIADMGIEIEGTDGKAAVGDEVSIYGNVYAAADFYNKSYNEAPGTISTVGNAATSVKAEQVQKVNSYNDDRLKDCNGVNTKSMYSGLYVNGASLLISSDRLIVPGSIAAMNCADITITTISDSSVDYADVWADGIVLDGYSLRKDTEGKELAGSSITMKAKAYVSDDLELNANSSSVYLNGEYYGYNYASTDNRTYTDAAIKNGKRKFTSNTKKGITDGTSIEGQAHYNSSAIILNGENTSLDFSQVDALYVAGQAYIETSKNVEESTTTAESIAAANTTEEVSTKTYSYPTEKTTGDNQTYTITSSDTTNKTAVQDYMTGEAISIKSNQLAYIPNWQVHDGEDGLYIKLPVQLRNLDAYKDVWENIDEIPVIKTVISGKPYYFFDFSNADKGMNQFMEEYASLFSDDTITDSSDKTAGEVAGLLDITDYDFFQVKMLQVSTDENGEFGNIYTNSAITTKVGNDFTIKANASNRAALTQAATNINDAVDEGTKNASDKVVYGPFVQSTVLATNVSTKLQSQYKETKWLLTNSCTNSDYISEAHTLSEDYITPINHFFDFSKIDSSSSRYYELTCGYGVWISDGDVKVGANSCKIGSGSQNAYDTSYKDGIVRGIIFAKGDVTFDTDVVEFDGLIVTGGKIIINNFNSSNTSMHLSSNEIVITSILKECDASRGETGKKNMSVVCDIFRQFQSTYVASTSSGDTVTDSMKSVTAIQFEDILSFKNWKKNVD